MEATSVAAISSLTTRSGKPRALSGAAIRVLGHDVDGEPTRIGDSLRTVSEGDALRRREYFLSGRRGPSAEVITVRLVRDDRGWLRWRADFGIQDPPELLMRLLVSAATPARLP